MIKENNYRLNRFNHFVNLEHMSMPHGTTESIEQLEAIALRAAIYAILGTYEPNSDEKINISDIAALAEELEFQGQKSLDKMHQCFQKIQE